MTGSTLATWAGSPNHYNGRNGYAVDHITLHIMVGTLESCRNWFALPQARAASHYGVGPDRVYQFVDEDNGSWADANMASDCSGVTIEHEGGMAGVPVTDGEVELSARLCADIARRYGWKRLWHDPTGSLKGNVYLHREIPGTDHMQCPDLAVNGLPVDRIINRANQLLGNEGDDDMVTAQDINKIAEAVWNFNQNGTKCRDRLQGIDKAANDIVKTVGERVWSFPIQSVQARDRLYGLDKLQVPALSKQVAQLTATVTAQQTAIDTLAKSLGANPADISEAVEKAVKAKLDSLQITVTTDDKEAE
ncbi:N-acetylmuramoyl-L-alanine amidase [Bifidobacterium olomucense]|uniref:N-acetylmuramoyl-L-alanine amidase n=1 Tax=Bifidobacterium olomucense TaxID=2675324 RepID=A0A7Y0EXF5_9BIFI|nr:N-acetylmuramoyl-L-alanine amidase [Bifidobacterium sp. DSM 109959]NMM98167.1 N-acetylmuramoyl-L-alanine amidase [Bifidobacterium sp. DSM 109959]